jgi:repressor LexA
MGLTTARISAHLSTLEQLTKKQEAVRQFIEDELSAGHPCPTHREIASHFRFASSFGAARHVRALIAKGALAAAEGKARALRLIRPAFHQKVTAEIPLFGSIPAGFGDERQQEREGCVVVDITTIGFKPTHHTFALHVKGDSMTGKFICDGDIVILEHGTEPRNGDIVAALINHTTTLKTFVERGGKQFLKAENPKFPDLIPSEELVIQGVYRGLIRKAS